MIKEYPKAKMFGTLPSYGLFVRHTKNIKLNNLSFSFKDKDDRSVIKINDVINGEISGLTAESTETSAPFVWLNNSEEIKIQNTSPLSRTNGDVNLLGNLSRPSVSYGTNIGVFSRKARFRV